MVSVVVDVRHEDGAASVKLQSDAWELNFQAPTEILLRLRDVRAADWAARRSIATGYAAGVPVFWAAGGSGADEAVILIGADDEGWSIAFTVSATVADEIVRTVEAERTYPE
ncbi:hypothetical protein ACI2K4_03875 [Micromonospora sp. NPDC050397]|uniref:hypothetical protein n=1 Tax=Micromonospora sp. NPDC050397 TaxID=3364279 RepID=UPI00384C8246